MALERWTNLKPRRRTRSPRYGVPSCRGESAGVAKRPRELISHTRNPYRNDSQTVASLCGRSATARGRRAAGAAGCAPRTPCTSYSDEKVANREIRVWHGATENGPRRMDKSKTPPTHLGSCRYLTLPRGFGFVHHSRAILYHEVPNPNITIRNFLIAVRARGGVRLVGEPGGRRGGQAAARDARRAHRVPGAAYNDEKVANREIRVWYFVIENGY
jgi:hypothetical protein